MFKKKDIDITSIVKKAYINAKLDSGLLEEQKQEEGSSTELAFREPFNPEEDLAFVKITPKRWGIKGSVDADQLDTILTGIVGTAPGGINKFKNSIKTVNKVLGKSPGPFSIPTGDSTLQEINTTVVNTCSSLALNSLLHSIIYNQEAGAAGKIFEGLVSRMVGGEKSLTDTIDDLMDEGGNLISLKLIDPTSTNIQGSKFNLAKGIAAATSGGDMSKGVTYLVCMKDKKSNPFSFSTFSFTINRYNYFNFMLKKNQQISAKEIQDFINTNTFMPAPGQETEEEDVVTQKKSGKKKAFRAKKYDVNEDFFEESIDQYAIDMGAVENDIQSINRVIKNIISNNNAQISSLQKSVSKPLWEQYLSNLLLEPTKTDTGKPIKLKTFKEFRNSIENLSLIIRDEDKKIELFEDDSAILKQLESARLKSNYEETKNKIYTLRGQIYNERFNLLKRQIEPVIKFATDIENILITKSSEVKAQAIEAGKTFQTSQPQDIKSIIDQFFGTINSRASKPGSQTQFDITIPQAKELAMSTGGDLDEDFEDFIVEAGFLFSSAEKSAQFLKKYIEPLFGSVHNIKNGLKSFFIADQPYGIEYAKQNILVLQNEIKDLPVDAKASKLQENINNKPLTKHWSDDILKDILND